MWGERCRGHVQTCVREMGRPGAQAMLVEYVGTEALGRGCWLRHLAAGATYVAAWRLLA